MSMLDLAAFRATELTRDPFEFLVVPGFVKAEARARINADFPVVGLPGSFPLSEVRFGPEFGTLIEELRGAHRRAARPRRAPSNRAEIRNRPQQPPDDVHGQDPVL